MKKLPRSFYSRDTLTVAKDLLGKFLVKDGMVGKIVETEAYTGICDKAAHAYWKKRETCFPLFERSGLSYVYFTYGMYYMLNAVSHRDGAAVLIRALEPVSGVDRMLQNRGFIIIRPGVLEAHSDNISEKLLKNIASGPGKLTQALKITKEHNNIDLTTSTTFYIASASAKTESKLEITETTRIGIDYAKEYKDKLWRFYIKGNRFVSKK